MPRRIVTADECDVHGKGRRFYASLQSEAP